MSPSVCGAVGHGVEQLPDQERSYLLLIPPFGVNTAAVYEVHDYQGHGLLEGPNDLTAAALRVEPRLEPWRRLLAELTGCEPILAGSGATWYVEGSPEEFGLAGRTSLSLRRERARLVGVRTVPSGWNGSGPGST
jgi:4-diphosphocytidyl-2-C-methyl-D-erythritol kinase